MKTNIQFTGVKEIDAVFRNLPLEFNHKVIQAANVAAAEPLIQEEKLSAPEGPTGNLVDSIGAVKVPFSKAGVLGEVELGPRRHGRFKGHAGHLVEFGTKKRSLRSNGANRGVMPARPFARPSLARTKDKVLGRIKDMYGLKLWQFMKRRIPRG